MIAIRIPLRKVIIDVAGNIDLASLPREAAMLHLTQAYAFLPPPIAVEIDDGIATITSAGESDITGKTERLFEQAGAEARRGRYSQAASLYRRVIEGAPAHTEAHYNLGMAYLEMGDHQQAETCLINALNLKPDEPYALLLLGNIYLKHRDRPDIAERLYLQAAAAAPADPYILANIGGLLAKREQHAVARDYFDQAIAADPRYPNAYYGKALSLEREGDDETAAAVLETLFAQPESIDIRAEPVYQEARRLYLLCNGKLAEAGVEEHMSYVRAWRDRLEQAGGVEIELVHDPRLSLPSVAEIAWHRSSRKRHVIRYRDTRSAVLPHLIAHELQHIALETAARQAECNRFFITTDATREDALRSISAEVNQLKRSGELGGQLETFLDQIVSGLANQLFNTPLDFVIEHRLYHEHPAIRPSQFVSLYQTHKQNRQALDDA